MSEKLTRNASEAILPSMTEEELANWLREQGVEVVQHRGRFWKPTHFGFFHAIHWMARMSAEEATRPTPWCWGFRTTLCDNDADSANGALPVHVLCDVAGYDMQALSSRQRNKVRNCRKSVEFVEFLKPDLLQQQGYGVAVSAQKRTGYGKILTLEQYRKSIEHYFKPRRGLIIGGLINGKLGGYIISHAVGSTAYVDVVHLATEHLRSNIGIGLFFEWMQVCKRSETIREVIHSPHARENTGLSRHKEELGFSVVKAPSQVWFMPPMEPLVRKFRPHAYYRLTGHD